MQSSLTLGWLKMDLRVIKVMSRLGLWVHMVMLHPSILQLVNLSTSMSFLFKTIIVYKRVDH